MIKKFQSVFSLLLFIALPVFALAGFYFSAFITGILCFLAFAFRTMVQTIH